MYALIENNTVSKYPYSFSQLRKDNPNTSYPRNPSDEVLQTFGVYKVSPTNKPVVDLTKNVTEEDPVQVNGAWLQSWVISEATQEEIDSRIAALKQQINNHREKLIVSGCNVSIANVGTVYVTGTQEDVRNVAGLGQGAIVRIMTGDETTVDFRDGNNNMFTLTPQQMLELWQKSAGYISAIYQSSWNIKEMDPIPTDYISNTSYWPSNDL